MDFRSLDPPTLTSNIHETLFIQSVTFDLVGIDTLIACLSQKDSQLLSISTGNRKNVVAVGGFLGFQLP